MKAQKQHFIKHLIITGMILFSLVISSTASNVTVSNTQLTAIDGDSARISFDLQWDHSWRKDSEEPYNYDGVWIFVKYRDCLEKQTGSPSEYLHAWLDTDSTRHTINSSTVGGAPVSLICQTGLTNVSGTDRGMGVFIYQEPGTRKGDVIADSISLLWRTGEHSPAEDATANTYDIQVFAIEMVYVPTDSFYLGDGISNDRFYDNALGGSYQFKINSANMTYSTDNGENLAADASQNITINPDFPNGYQGYWIMKYEISQDQYRGFLNTLSRSMQDYRVEADIAQDEATVSNKYILSNTQTMSYRNAIVCPTIIGTGGEPVTFYMDYDGDLAYNENEDGANIACNYLSKADVLAYMDWAALRPITEMEYEKACRGPYEKPFGRTEQKPWGNAIINEVTGIENEGTPSETASNLGVEGICNYNANLSINGPLRCGFAATDTSDRYTSGAGYYGVYEMAGNVMDLAITLLWINSYPDADDFDGKAGDGLLSNTARANVDTWPQGADGSGDSEYYLITKGGYFYRTGTDYESISYRWGWHSNDNQRNFVLGGRGGRYVKK